METDEPENPTSAESEVAHEASSTKGKDHEHLGKEDPGKKAGVGDRGESESPKPSAARGRRGNSGAKGGWATLLAFLLCVLCLSALGYGLYRFFTILSFTPSSTSDLVFLTRAGISTMAIIISIACVVLGFAAFMIGARGEFRVEAEHPAVKGLLNSGAPGLFFVLCGTVILCVLLANRFEHGEVSYKPSGAEVQNEKEISNGNAKPQDESSGAQAIQSSQASPDKTIKTSTHDVADKTVTTVSRDIASHDAPVPLGDKPDTTEGFFLDNETLYQSFAEVAYAQDITDKVVKDFVGTWMAEEDSFPHRVSFRWKVQQQVPADNILKDKDIPGFDHALGEGILIVPTEDNSQMVSFIESLRTLTSFKGGSDYAQALPWKKLLKDLAPLFQKTIIFRNGQSEALLAPTKQVSPTRHQ